MMATVTFEQATRVYPGTDAPAVDTLDLEIDDGEFLVLVGPSGCGKSTTLRMLAGLEPVDDGEIFIGDRNVSDTPPKDRDIAMVFQTYALYPHMTVAENIGFHLKIKKMPKPERVERVREAARILDLEDFLDRKPAKLSGGQRQRVAMGRAIVREPQVFLMDEPLSNLDAKLRVQTRTQIAALQRRLGVTTVYVTHDQVEAMTMGDRVAVLKAGELQQCDAPQTLYDRPDTIFVAGFIGSPSMNIAEADLVEEGGDLFVELEQGAARLRVQDAALEKYPGIRDRAGQRVAIGMRPEHFTSPEEVPPDQVWSGREIKLVEMLGAEMLVHFKTGAPPIVSEDMRAAIDDEEAFEELQRQAAAGGQDFVARFEPGAPPKVGDRRDYGFETEYLHFFDPDSGRALR
jgi:multiple sugar transport system ATP-binding protein